MDLALLVYGISLISSMTHAFGGLMILGGTIFFMALFYRVVGLTCESYDSQREVQLKNEKRVGVDKVLKRLGIAIAVMATFNIIVPSERTAYMMVGAYATQKVAENEKVQETGKKVLTLIEQKLDSYIDDGFDELERKNKAKKGKKNE